MWEKYSHRIYKEDVSQNSIAKIVDVITNWFIYGREMNQTCKEKL